MNPYTTMNGLLDALRDDDREEVKEYAERMLGWLYDGGFTPMVNTANTRTLLTHLCEHLTK